MNKSTIGAAVALALSAGTAHALPIHVTLTDNPTGVFGTDTQYTTCSQDFLATREFRMCQPDGASLGGGIPFQKDTVVGTESWVFNDAGQMTGTGGTSVTGGITTALQAYTMAGYLPASGAPNGGQAMDQGAIFLSNAFAFLAPTLGSGAGNLYGEGQYTSLSATTFEMVFPVLEAQWSGTFFQLGASTTTGIVFHGTVDPGTGAFGMWAEHTITLSEDIGGAGFNDWTAQWYYTGTITEVPVPAAVWLFGSGLLGLVGVARRKKNSA